MKTGKKAAKEEGGLKDYKKSIMSFFLDNELVSLAFIILLIFWLWQHSTGFSWDFAVYSLNAQYIFADGYYFEWLRQPLPSVVLGVFSFLGYPAAEYAYIIAVSFLHLYSSINFAAAFGIDRASYYIFSATIFAFWFGFFAGTEILSISLVQLFLSCLSGKKSGLLIGLSSLARYTNIPYVVLLLFQRNLQKIAASILLFLAVVSPWLLYSLAKTGNPFTSVTDSYLLNISFRPNYIDFLIAEHFFLIAGLSLPFFAAGLTKLRNAGRNDRVVLILLAITVVFYAFTPFKEARYLFPSIIAFAYFSCKSVEKIKNREKILFKFLAANVAVLIFVLPYAQLESPNFYRHVAERSHGCAVMSNAWVALNYYGTPSTHLAYAGHLEDGIRYELNTNLSRAVENGYRIVIFKNIKDPFSTGDISNYPVVEEDQGFVILGDVSKCRPPERIDKPYSAVLSEIALEKYGRQLKCSFLGCRLV